MHRLLLVLATGVATLLAALSAHALTPGNTVLVPAAGRVNEFITDLYVANPGEQSVQATVYWLERGQDNSSLTTSFGLEIRPGETAVLDDVIFSDFGLEEGTGAFLVVADGLVIVNSRIYALTGDATFGQGFEGVPASHATTAGTATLVVGLSHNDSFRSNVYALADSGGALMSLALLDPSGVEIAATEVSLDPYEPYLRRVDLVFGGIADVENATLLAEVTAGSVVIGASKVDNQSTDPTTLESAATAATTSESPDGTYQIALYDGSGFASGGNIVIADGAVAAIHGTYTNWDKLDQNVPACTLIFRWGMAFESTPLGDFETGVSFVDDYSTGDSGQITWTIRFSVDGDTPGFTGTVDAVGSGFSSDPDPALDESGCNGAFPTMDLFGGKTAS